MSYPISALIAVVVPHRVVVGLDKDGGIKLFVTKKDTYDSVSIGDIERSRIELDEPREDLDIRIIYIKESDIRIKGKS